MRTLLVLAVLGAAAYGFYHFKDEIFDSGVAGSLPRVFKAEIPGYAEKVRNAKSGEGTLQGKPVLICMRANDHGGEERFGKVPCVDRLTPKLPPELIPEDPSEVEIIIGMFWDDEVVGSYGMPGNTMSQALVEYVTLKFVDAKSGALVARHDVEGTHPPMGGPQCAARFRGLARG
ncbi:MAG: hypothetical protein ACI8UO_001220 [Verrucomicrobiales bacterium]|jgi:hypothetical protein